MSKLDLKHAFCGFPLRIEDPSKRGGAVPGKGRRGGRGYRDNIKITLEALFALSLFCLLASFFLHLKGCKWLWFVCKWRSRGAAERGEANIIAGELQLDSRVTEEEPRAVLDPRVQLTRQQGKPIIRDNQISWQYCKIFLCFNTNGSLKVFNALCYTICTELSVI